MVRSKDEGGIKSNLIVTEVQKRPCLFDSGHQNYGDRAEKSRCWDEVCENVVPSYSALDASQKLAAGKEVQKRWRSIRDSYTKAYRQGKCGAAPAAGPRRRQYHTQMEFLLKALQNKKPRYSQDKYESFSELSNSPQHPPPEDIPRIKIEKVEAPEKETKFKELPDKVTTLDKSNQASLESERNTNSLEIKIDANSILPEDHFDDDKLFMNSLIPLFKKMDDDTRLLCRIEVLKIIRYALQGNKHIEASRINEDNFFKDRMGGVPPKEESMNTSKNESKLSMTTRSADGSRPVRKRKEHSPSPLQSPPKRRGPGRPRKVRPPPSDSEDEQAARKRSPKSPKLKVPLPRMSDISDRMTEFDESLSKVTSVDQLSAKLFMKVYNLDRSKDAPLLVQTPQGSPVTIKSEPLEINDLSTS